MDKEEHPIACGVAWRGVVAMGSWCVPVVGWWGGMVFVQEHIQRPYVHTILLIYSVPICSWMYTYERTWDGWSLVTCVFFDHFIHHHFKFIISRSIINIALISFRRHFRRLHVQVRVVVRRSMY